MFAAFCGFLFHLYNAGFTKQLNSSHCNQYGKPWGCCRWLLPGGKSLRNFVHFRFHGFCMVGQEPANRFVSSVLWTRASQHRYEIHQPCGCFSMYMRTIHVGQHQGSCLCNGTLGSVYHRETSEMPGVKHFHPIQLLANGCQACIVGRWDFQALHAILPNALKCISFCRQQGKLGASQAEEVLRQILPLY